MTNTHREKSWFNLGLEILASIPPEPASVLLNDLRDDFGLDKQADVLRHFDALGMHGIKVETTMEAGRGRVVAVDKKSWGRAQAVAETYWSQFDEVASAA